MKNLLLLLLPLLFLVFNTTAQNTYAEAIQQGDRALRQGQYKTAINKYFSAEAFDPSKKDVVRRKVNVAFDRIEALKKQAETALAETEKAKEETQIALQKANKLVDAFYFYEDRFALAYGEKDYDNVFYFIDKNGDEVEKLGQWTKAEQFDIRGYARIKKEGRDYLLDTFGQVYPVAYDIEDLNERITVLDLSGKELMEIPPVVFEHQQLEVLLLNLNMISSIPVEIRQLEQLKELNLYDNELMEVSAEMGQLKQLVKLNLARNNLLELPVEMGQLEQLTFLDVSSNILNELPAEIGQLKQLMFLDVSYSTLMKLPAEIGNLQNLKNLDLSGNPIPKEQGEKIEQLLPNCNIAF